MALDRNVKRETNVLIIFVRVQMYADFVSIRIDVYRKPIIRISAYHKQYET